MRANKPTHTAYFEDGTTYQFTCATEMRIGWAMEEASKRNTKVLRII